MNQPPVCLQIRSSINFNHFFSLQNLALVQRIWEHSSCVSAAVPQGGVVMLELVLARCSLLSQLCPRGCTWLLCALLAPDTVQEPEEGMQYWVCGKVLKSQIREGKAHCHSVFGTCVLGLYSLVEIQSLQVHTGSLN